MMTASVMESSGDGGKSFHVAYRMALVFNRERLALSLEGSDGAYVLDKWRDYLIIWS